MSINTLDQCLDRHLIDMPTYMRSTLDQQSLDTWPSVNCLVHWSKISWLSTKMPIECQSSVNQGVDRVRTKYWSWRLQRVLTDGIDQHSTADTISTYHDTKTLSEAHTCISIHISNGQSGSFINILSRRAAGFHRWAELFEHNFFIRKTIFFFLDDKTRQAKSSS